MSEESSKVSSTPEDVKYCANCSNYSWGQPADQSKIQQCAKCKFISYCSKECQQEHWVKVHKHHCKYLAQQRVMPQSRHDPANCTGCKEQVETGPVEMANPANPVLGCPLAKYCVPVVFRPDFGDGGKTHAPLPFPLGEMTGQFLTKAEHTVCLMMRLQNKMQMIKHPAWTIHPEASEDMYKKLNGLRHGIWEAYIVANPGHVLETAIARKVCRPEILMELFDLTNIIDQKLSVVKFSDPTVCRPWDTFKLLLTFLVQFNIEPKRKEAECVGLPELSKALQERRLSSVQFNKVWSEVLDTMPDKLVPYTALVKIVCGGQMNQTCAGCSKDIEVAELQHRIPTDISPSFYRFNYISASFCGNSKCHEKVAEEESDLVKIYFKISVRSSGYRCDTCGLPSTANKGHRCSRCLTKVYCGVQCRDEDWRKVHKLVCREGEVERKRKGGGQERKKAAKDEFDGLVDSMKELGVKFEYEGGKL
eukprot:GFUD01006228.1.p1 GENE.GFUD01006228.1~~GFUD01006228.1.p1  ORF type:complete len:477 (-),score=143.81 GFUD01006228.1:96-1526(-)